MSNIHDKIRALISRAAHRNTGIAEREVCIQKAEELFNKYDLIIIPRPAEVTSEEMEAWYDNFDGEEEDFETFSEVLSFSIQKALKGGSCKKCGHQYFTGNQIASTEANGATHFECRDYWHEGGK